ncbi:hypothetical protein BGZ89_009337 [Linnemannia elongata]|nr:hypothetical protein BGZ89_009337 [Linnemannia elongata]
MLSLIRPSSSLCLHQLPDSSSSSTIVTGAPASDSLQTASTSTSITIPSLHNEKKKASKASSVASTSSTRPSKASFLTTPTSTQLNNTSSYKDLSKNNSGSLPPSPTDTVGNSVELLPTQLSSKPKTFHNNSNITNAQNVNASTESCDRRQTQIIQPLFHSLQSFLPESTSSSSRLGFWANLKAHYLAAKATSISWPGSGSGNNNARSNNGSNLTDDAFSPPIALRLSNCTPVAAVDATAPQSASLTLTDMLLSLPNVAAPSTHAYRGSMNYPVSVAAMDKFKPIRSDTIPLKTFTYHETPVIERLPVLTHIVKSPLRKTKESTPSTTTGSLSPPSPSSLPVTKNAKSGTTDKSNSKTQESSLLPPLPRHLAARETRSNAAYLRMMAAELRMIRARKLISPLKPRGYLPRRKEPFQAAIHVLT